MRLPLRAAVLGALLCVCAANGASSAYNGHPKLVVIVVIDQFRGDYLERYHDQFGEGGFRLWLHHGANFTDCYFNYANTSTAPGHTTLLTGAYSNGHGIMANQWWDNKKKKMVSSVFDDSAKTIGGTGNEAGVSPHNLLADTLGDELRLATQGKSRVFAISLKDRAAVLPGGLAGQAYWTDHESGDWVTSTYYRDQPPEWVAAFNKAGNTAKYLNREWNDENGRPLFSTKVAAGKAANFYDVLAPTPFANDYEIEFAQEIIAQEKLGGGPTTDLLVLTLSANDMLGHEVGPDAPEMKAMALALDRQLAGFFNFLGKQMGLANTWLVLAADHGVAPLPETARKLHIPAAGLDEDKLAEQLNQGLSARFTPGKKTNFVHEFEYPLLFLNEEIFAAAGAKELDAERAAGEALKSIGMRGYFTRAQLAVGEVPNTEEGLRYAHSYSPLPGWFVIAVPPIFAVGGTSGTNHGLGYSYDTHVPLAFYGLPFRPGTYRTHTEPVDMASTLASLLGINAPTHAIGRVLTEGLAPGTRSDTPPPTKVEKYAPLPGGGQ